MNAEMNRIVQQIIDGLVASGEEIGLQVAAYVDGELAVDCWAGLADQATGRVVDGDTLFQSFSSAKGITSTCLHLLADRGLVDYDTPVARYWPEFAANGKGGITLRHVLTHTAGVPQLPPRATPEMALDWEAMCAAIAALTPLWPPGAVTYYHAATFGWLVGEVVRRADGRPIGQVCREELCEPLGACDIYLALPEEAESRVATLVDETLAAGSTPPRNPDPLASQVLPRDMMRAEVWNRPVVRRACVPANGTMSARGLARHYAMLAGHGELEGVRLLSRERVDIIRTLQTDAVDQLLGGPSRRALGYSLGGAAEAGGNILYGRSGGEFGYAGHGWSVGFADPERGLAFGLTKNYLRVTQPLAQTAAYRGPPGDKDRRATQRRPMRWGLDAFFSRSRPAWLGSADHLWPHSRLFSQEVSMNRSEDLGAPKRKAGEEEYSGRAIQGQGAASIIAWRRAATQAAFFTPYLSPGMRLLDCGCGPGSITCDLARIVAPGEVVGIDNAPEQVEGAVAYAAQQGVSNVRYQAASVYDLPFPDASFDAVFAHTLFDHLAEPLKALAEMRRVLRPGGVMGVRSPDFDGHIIAPPDSALATVLRMQKQLYIRNGEAPCVGKHLRGLLHQAGCVRVIATASYDCYGTPESLQYLAKNADMIGAHSVRYGISPEEAARLVAELKAWTEDPAAFFADNRCEAVGWV